MTQSSTFLAQGALFARFCIASLILILLGCSPLAGQDVAFNRDKDLLLAQYDCKTDVDDLHSAAALASLMRHQDYSDIEFHVVGGSYGMQNGAYVPPNTLFDAIFPGNWTDAHTDWDGAVATVTERAAGILDAGGAVWIAEAGQSDFSADVLAKLMKNGYSTQLEKQFHVVQHSKWNEQSTTPKDLTFVKANCDYIKIPDGNAVGNGSPGFVTKAVFDLEAELQDPDLRDIWELALAEANRYNGENQRYRNNDIFKGGLDFSDMSEACFILGLGNLKDAAAFFEIINTTP
ncbi:hypothetical protein SAMN04490243_1887 [Robiginitalea myxolifaciens]|uniref:Uncharacterized protein n=1 Tax=Robiginitalea myxolifaciens TaxID=400055 RepID=A0A1I6GY91_9FLAO|nr:hypothetical protein [Robiginitalea myxolifaciens]SFR47130.1 hypothetical protein SAMN04490243_1887 [Robiginitalea myxolifaciens]